jgi:hypothetical protein
LKPRHVFCGPSQRLERFKRWSIYTPAIAVCPQPRLLSRRGVAPVLSSRPPYGGEGRQVSRAPLPNVGVTSVGETCTVSSEGVTPPSSLLLAHVPLPLGSLLLRHLASFEESWQVVRSPCCPREFPDVISENLSLDAGSPTPAGTPCALTCFFHDVIGLPHGKSGSAFRVCPANYDFSQAVVSRLQIFRDVPASKFARPPDRPYRCGYHRRAAGAFTSGPIVLCYLRTHRIC